jgi:hypothetical protein
VSKELAALIEQLRHACSVALGDLLAHGMPAETSTGKMLLEASATAERPRDFKDVRREKPATKFAVKRYAVFTGDKYYPDGGWNDYKSSHDTLAEARRMPAPAPGSWSQIVDLMTGQSIVHKDR